MQRQTILPSCTPQHYLIPFSFLELLFFRHYWATPIGDTIPCFSTDHMGDSCKMAYIDLRQKLKIGFIHFFAVCLTWFSDKGCTVVAYSVTLWIYVTYLCAGNWSNKWTTCEINDHIGSKLDQKKCPGIYEIREATRRDKLSNDKRHWVSHSLDFYSKYWD